MDLSVCEAAVLNWSKLWVAIEVNLWRVLHFQDDRVQLNTNTGPLDPR